MTSRTESFRVMMSIYRSLHSLRARPARIRTIQGWPAVRAAGSWCCLARHVSKRARPNALINWRGEVTFSLPARPGCAIITQHGENLLATMVSHSRARIWRSRARSRAGVWWRRGVSSQAGGDDLRRNLSPSRRGQTEERFGTFMVSAGARSQGLVAPEPMERSDEADVLGRAADRPCGRGRPVGRQ